jgi:hypothetical protein
MWNHLNRDGIRGKGAQMSAVLSVNSIVILNHILILSNTEKNSIHQENPRPAMVWGKGFVTHLQTILAELQGIEVLESA